MKCPTTHKVYIGKKLLVKIKASKIHRHYELSFIPAFYRFKKQDRTLQTHFELEGWGDSFFLFLEL